jgi:hypothetical protein
VRRLRAEGVVGKSGRLLEKGDVYRLLKNRSYRGEAVHNSPLRNRVFSRTGLA